MDCLWQVLTEENFSRQEELIFRDCDARGRARPGTLISLLAATAGHDFDARGLPYEKLLEIRQVILLSRISLRIHRPPTVGEIVTITTWEDGVHGAHMGRNFEISDSAGALCVSARSDWILVEPVERRILRPETFTGKELHSWPREIDAPACRKIRLPQEGCEDLGGRKIVYSDLDCNGHVYSGNYGDIVWDALPEELQSADLREFSLNYAREATLGECLNLRGFRDGATYRMEGMCGGGICFTCACELKV